MEDKYILENYLTLTKSLATLYLNGAIESSNEVVKKVMIDGLNEMLTLQGNLYNLLVNKNFYKVENVNKTAINKLIEKLNQDCC